MKTLQGIITSLKNQNTATVEVTNRWQHPLYKKYVKRTKNYACHYENVKLEIGQEVTIQECRPLSRTKHFLVMTEGMPVVAKPEVKVEAEVKAAAKKPKTVKKAKTEKSKTK